jgi:hypothetical protein
MTCPHCECELTEAQIKSIWASYTSSRRQVHAGGKSTGRRPVPAKCPWCGVDCRSKGEAKKHCKAAGRG